MIEFILENLFNARESDVYRQIFYEINRTADGMCTKEQFLNAFWSMGFVEVSEHELDALLAYVDDDRNGYVTFNEFFNACVDPKDVLDPRKLQEAFRIFDQDASGSITIDEFRYAVDREQAIPEGAWENIFAQIDDDGSGEINIEEFTEMMEAIFKQTEG